MSQRNIASAPSSDTAAAVTFISRAVSILLIIVMSLRILSYFTLFPDSVALTQLVKTGLRILLTGISAVGYYYLRTHFPHHRLQQQNWLPVISYGAYLLLGLVSVMWSSLVHYTLLQWAMIVEALVFAWFYIQWLVFYNGLSNQHARFSKIFGRATFWIGLGFLVGLLIDPDTFYRQTHGGEVSRLGGFIINPNELGMLAVLGAIMAYVEWMNKGEKTWNLLVWVVSVAVLLLTQSRSSLGAFLLVTGLTVYLSGNLKLQLAAVVAAVLLLPVLVQTIILKQGDLEEVMSMTGRLPFWQDLLADGFTKKPLLGYGFMCISFGEYFYSIHAYAAKMTHNTFIQVLLNLGLIGAFICLVQMVLTFHAIFKTTNTYLKTLAGFMLIPLLINSFTEFGIFGESNYGIQFYQLLLFLFVFLAVPKKQVEKIHLT